MKKIDSTFTRYELTDVESATAAILNEYQEAFIQNELAMAAEKKLALVFSAGQQFIQEEAYLSGQIAMLRYLLDNSKAAVLALNQPR